MRLKSLISLFLAIIFSLGTTGLSLAKTEIIKVKNRKASSLIPVVEQILSKDGKVIADRIMNAIIITDSHRVCEEAKALVARLDTPLHQVRIKVRLVEEGQAENRGVSVAGRGRARRGIGVTLQDGSRDSGYFSETMISVLSGSQGYINVSEMVPYSERWVFLCRRYAHVTDLVRFYRLDTGMEVRPVVRGDNVMIEIIPRIAYWADEESGVVRFVEASTTLIAPRDKWVSLGGSDVMANEVIREILTRLNSQSRISLRLSLKADFQGE